MPEFIPLGLAAQEEPTEETIIYAANASTRAFLYAYNIGEAADAASVIVRSFLQTVRYDNILLNAFSLAPNSAPLIFPLILKQGDHIRVNASGSIRFVLYAEIFQ